MGLTFKENCADIRNSGIKSVIEKLKKGCKLDLHDPWAESAEIKKFGIKPKLILNNNTYDGIIIAVAHQKFKDMKEHRILSLCKKNYIIYDLKYLFSKRKINLRL